MKESFLSNFSLDDSQGQNLQMHLIMNYIVGVFSDGITFVTVIFIHRSLT